MKNKKLIAAAVAAGILATSTSGALADNLVLSVNGEGVNAPIIMQEEVPMLPLRALAEKIGYTVEWEAETGTVILTGLPRYITFKPNTQEYTFAKAAPVTLETKSTIYNDRTYVPAEFISDILGLAYDTSAKGDINILTGENAPVVEEEEMSAKTVTVISVSEYGITVNDEDLGEVIVMAGENTVITKDGKEAAISDIKEGDTLSVVYGRAMTLSLPPQTTAESIEIVTATAQEGVEFEGTILEITEEGHILISSEDYESGVALVVTEETKITDAELEVGMKIKGTHSMAMTRSIPPQTAAITIEVDEEKAEEAETVEFEGTILEITENGLVIVSSKDYKNGIALIIGKNTVIEDADGNEVSIDELKADMEIKGTHSMAMTKSIPPQTVAATIVLK